MSGVSKDHSMLLKHGDASKCPVKSGADNLTKIWKGDSWTTCFTRKGDGCEHTFQHNSNMRKQHDGSYSTSTSWSAGWKKQICGLTFDLGYNKKHNCGKFTHRIDWGELYPNFHFYTAGDFEFKKDTPLTQRYGLSHVDSNWGLVAEFCKCLPSNTNTIKEKCWFTSGNTKVGACIAVDLSGMNMEFKTLNAGLEYKVNNDLSVWLHHTSNKNKCDLQIGTIGLSSVFKKGQQSYGFKISRAVCGEVNYAVGVNCKSCNGTLSFDNHLNLSGSKIQTVGSHVKITHWFSLPVVQLIAGNFGNWETWYVGGSKMSIGN